MTIQLANELISRNKQVMIVSFYGGRPFYNVLPEVTCISFFRRKRNLLLAWPVILYRLLSTIQHHHVSCFINVGVSMMTFSFPLKWISKVKIISWEHFNVRRDIGTQVIKAGRKLSVKYADYIITLTEQDKIDYQCLYTPKAAVLCIPNFISFKTNHTADIHANTFLAVGRLTYQKGFENLLEIWERLHRERKNGNWKLVIVGTGDQEQMLKEYIVSHEVGSSVRIDPPTVEIEQYYKSSSVFLMTSRWEGLPMVLIEAKSFGLPCISYNCPTGPAQLIRNNIDGYLVEDQDKTAFGDKMQEVISMDIETRKRLSVEAKSDSERYSASSIVPVWLKVLAE